MHRFRRYAVECSGQLGEMCSGGGVSWEIVSVQLGKRQI